MGSWDFTNLNDHAGLRKRDADFADFTHLSRDADFADLTDLENGTRIACPNLINKTGTCGFHEIREIYAPREIREIRVP